MTECPTATLCATYNFYSPRTDIVGKTFNGLVFVRVVYGLDVIRLEVFETEKKFPGDITRLECFSELVIGVEGAIVVASRVLVGTAEPYAASLVIDLLDVSRIGVVCLAGMGLFGTPVDDTALCKSEVDEWLPDVGHACLPAGKGQQ